jgi:glycine cleavage system aminomethyltransferase T
MAQMVFKMRQLLEYIRNKGINQDFKSALVECVRLTQDVPEVEIQPVGTVARDVARKLDAAYRAYHREYSRPLSYDQYEKFMAVCHGWGSFIGDKDMMRWKQETEEEYGGAERREAERMQELLGKLKELVDEYVVKR